MPGLYSGPATAGLPTGCRWNAAPVLDWAMLREPPNTHTRIYTADLHLHSRYAYATSKRLSLENLAAWAKIKGIDLLSCADFTHPTWMEELRRCLVEDGTGLFGFDGVKFVLGTEVSCVYRQGGRSRRVHLLVFAPDLATVEALNKKLAAHGNLKSDGRPVLGLSARDLVELVLGSNPDCIVIPAHIWTPWYGILGSKSGFDSLEECFLDMAPHIRAVETGLSSDPAMNWMIPQLAMRTIVSFSDAHSLPKLGREVTVFHGEMSYQGLARALASQGVAYTVEFYPEEGKYHYSGHRKCGVQLAAGETLGSNGRCPVCGRPMTLGVLHRVATLSNEVTSDQGISTESISKDGTPSPGVANKIESNGGLVSSPLGRPPFMRLVPLVEIISQTLKVGTASKRVQTEYRRVVGEIGSEFKALIQASYGDLTRVGGESLAQAVIRARAGEVYLEPGYDGVFGSVRVVPADQAMACNDGRGC